MTARSRGLTKAQKRRLAHSQQEEGWHLLATGRPPLYRLAALYLAEHLRNGAISPATQERFAVLFRQLFRELGETRGGKAAAAIGLTKRPGEHGAQTDFAEKLRKAYYLAAFIAAYPGPSVMTRAKEAAQKYFGESLRTLERIWSTHGAMARKLREAQATGVIDLKAPPVDLQEVELRVRSELARYLREIEAEARAERRPQTRKKTRRRRRPPKRST